MLKSLSALSGRIYSGLACGESCGAFLFWAVVLNILGRHRACLTVLAAYVGLLALLYVLGWLRFSLGTMLTVVTVLCGLLGWNVQRAKTQRQIVAWGHEKGGTVCYEYELQSRVSGPLIPLQKRSLTTWLCRVFGDDFCYSVYEVDLHGTEVTGADLARLAALVELRKWDLGCTQVKGPGMADLKPLSRLEYLGLGGEIDLEASFIESLKQLPSLRFLRLDGSERFADDVADSLDMSVQT